MDTLIQDNVRDRFNLGQHALVVEPSLYGEYDIAATLDAPGIEAANTELGPRVAWSLNWTTHGWAPVGGETQ